MALTDLCIGKAACFLLLCLLSTPLLSDDVAAGYVTMRLMYIG
jgi:hypothetical protein